MNIISFLNNSSEKYPTKIAVVDNENSVTYQQLYDDVQKFSSSLKTFDTNEIISLISENSISFIIAYLGLINAGRIVHLISPEISEHNLSQQLKSSGSKMIISTHESKDNFANYSSLNVPIISFSDIKSKKVQTDENSKSSKFAYLTYTSGTTSDPKGVAITHEMVEFTTRNIVNILKYSDTDVNILPLPLHHSFGLGCIHTSLFVGSTLVLLKNASNLEIILKSLKKYSATTLAAIPITLTKFLKFDKNILKEEFLNLRLIITNSTSVPKPTVLNFKEILKNGHLATYYGLTEASRSTFMIFDKVDGREESVGKTGPGIEIKIVNQEQNDPDLGEIWIKGNNVIKKYWNNIEADKNLVDGWLQTGDVGYLDKENYLFLKGRNDEMINIGGEKVVPFEIEEIVKRISGIEDVAAFGINHEILGQTIKLNVVKTKDSNIEKSHILSHCIKNLEKFKIPSKIDFVEKIPKTEYGKVKRFMLK